jgi:hypothetical protein
VRDLTDAAKIDRFQALLGAAAPVEGTCWFTGGASAVLMGWRNATLDIDIALERADDEVLRALTRIKDDLRVNVEIASPGDFIPLPGGWRDRAVSIGRSGKLSFCHFDFYSQALAKLERGHQRDLADVAAMLDRGLVEAGRLRECFEEIEPQLYRFPAVDAPTFRTQVEAALADR